MTNTFDPADDGAKMSFADDMSYSDYLNLDKLLQAQNPISAAHDEMLFIIQHQTSELWMSLALHELNAARDHITAENFGEAFKMISRVARIFEQLNNAWDVLRTMTPSDYSAFRDALGSSSGFQSHQYRLIEFLVGNRNCAMLKVHEHRPDTLAQLNEELQRPSLYHVALHVVAKQLKVTLPDEAFRKTEPHQFNKIIEDSWTRIYENPADYWMLYELSLIHI